MLESLDLADVRSRRIRMQGCDWTPHESGEFAGFHDWLRHEKEESNKEIIGVRFWPHDDDVRQLILACRQNYIRERNGAIEVMLRLDVTYSEEHSDDQAFLCNQILVSDRGGICLALDITTLEEKEWDRLREYGGFG